MSIMKLSLLMFTVVALANPIAEPIPVDGEAVARTVDHLASRAIGDACTVSGKGSLNGLANERIVALLLVCLGFVRTLPIMFNAVNSNHVLPHIRPGVLAEIQIKAAKEAGL
ncbi:hypothetical protein EPUS_08775 [Endocarpon pusillum Z07020]|uniref:Uncharacterized protein n=1 Tax=Endocarpon pusillum (strain Z07020 / HMAS-L-300199) TaxID=1263415 RepID=U1HLT3_ENDPU|nr:uncharacterized protein EPUS_08775 [Endocarpon pusillum Z07020]ERF69964.1 hypothetical protein EPUS_08775 [Endocarpon pusillum Z07020]